MLFPGGCASSLTPPPSILWPLTPLPALCAALQALLESMVDAAENLCPNVMKKAHIRQDLIHASTEKISIPRTFVKNVLLEQSGIDILNKIRYVLGAQQPGLSAARTQWRRLEADRAIIGFTPRWAVQACPISSDRVEA